MGASDSSLSVVFRVEADAVIGGGHLMRCLTLANECRSRGWRTTFAVSALPERFWRLVVDAGHGIVVLPEDRAVPGSAGAAAIAGDQEDDAGATEGLLADESADWIVVDHYGLDEPWERRVRRAARRLLVIDDLGRNHECDLLLDQNYHADSASRYGAHERAGRRSLLGPAYALLRPGFYVDVPQDPRGGVLRRILVSFGASDPTGETAKSIEALLSFPRGQFEADVLADPSRLSATVVSQLRSQTDVRLRAWVDDPAPLMRAADLAIGAGGATAWERCACGLPALVITVAENQRPSMAALAEQGSIVLLGEAASVTARQISRVLHDFLADPHRLRAMSERALQLGIAEKPGAASVADTMLALS